MVVVVGVPLLVGIDVYSIEQFKGSYHAHTHRERESLGTFPNTSAIGPRGDVSRGAVRYPAY